MPSLDQWEQRLKPYFNRSLRIIGEIPLTRLDIDDIATGVRACINRNNLSEATRLLTQRYPHLFMAFLAGFGAHNTEKAYWIALGERLGVNFSHLFNYRWHHLFQQEVKRRNLPYFDYEDAANPFVTTIRFHGGIPAHSLPDFFERLLMPTIRRSGLNEVSTKQAMQVVLRTAYFVDSPVFNFLENSGQLGEDFFDACRRMARYYLQTHGDLQPAAELGLPEYVVESFGDWMEREKGDTQAERLRKPVLSINPYEALDRLWLQLPEQEIDLRYAGGELEWRIALPQQAVEHLPVRLLRRRQYTLIREIFYAVETAPEQVAVSLVFRGDQKEETLRRWTLPLLPAAGRAPLLTFRTTNGQQVRGGSSLPAEVLHLIYPADSEIHLDGDGRMVEEYSPMSGAWRGWQVHAWDLTDAWAVHVVRRGEVLGLPVPVAGRQPDPQIVGTRSPFSQGETPLYIGDLPALEVPLRYNAEPSEELKKWQVEIRSVWETSPIVQRQVTLDALASQVVLEDNRALVNMEHLLGSASPVGTYELRIHGPGSITTDFRLRLWPKLMPISLPRRLLPPEQNNQPIRFTLRLPYEAGCEVQAGAGDVQITKSIVGWDVVAGRDVFEVNINLIWCAEHGALVRVPVSIPIPRLRWALALEDQPGDLEWVSEPLQKSALALLQSGAAALHIQTSGLGALQRQAMLELVELDAEERLVQEAELKKTVFSSDWLRVPLNQFSDTLRRDCQQGRFDLVLWPRQGDPELRIPLLFAPRQMIISDVALTRVSELAWKITWQEDHPLKNRRLMLAPAWQPWQEPWELKVPDEARGEILMENISLPLTRYLIYFYVAPSWEAPRTTPPADLSPHLYDLTTAVRRLAEIEAQAHDSDEEYLRALIEKACIFHDLRDTGTRDKILSECPVPFVRCRNLRLMLGLLEWLEATKNESSTGKFLWRVIYKAEMVTDFLKRYRRTDPLLQRYLSHVGRGIEIYGQTALLIAERSDDPVVIFACLEHLLKREDEILILLVLDMLEKARLSDRDAVELLVQKLEWAVHQLAAHESTPYADRLLAALLPKLGQAEGQFTDQLPDIIARVFPYENDPTVSSTYLRLLLSMENEAGVHALMQGIISGKIRASEAEDIISTAPRFVFRLLIQAPETPAHQEWIHRMAAKFPSAAGVIRPGGHMRTPIGIGQIDRIEDSTRADLREGLLSSHAIRINLLIGDGNDRFRVWIDLCKEKIVLFEAVKAWTCPYCEFIHPDRRAMDRHYNRSHPHASRIYREIPAVIDLDRSKLEIV